MTTLPIELIYAIFEYSGEYRFRDNAIVRMIHISDTRYDLLRTIPKKYSMVISNSIIQVIFPIINSMYCSLIYTELIINNNHTSTIYFFKMNNKTNTAISTTHKYTQL